LRELQEQIYRARTITPVLIADVISLACPRLQAQQRTAAATVIHLVEAGASVDATLAVLELELPQWKLRRVIYDDGEWHCSLSKHIGVPAELDDMAEGEHESLPLAILSAFIEARAARLKTDQSPCRRFVPRRDTPFAATISLEPRNAGSSDNDELRRLAITTKQWPKAAARRYLCGNCDPGCDHAGVRGASCRSALDGSCPRLASRSDLGSVRPDRPQRPAGLL